MFFAEKFFRPPSPEEKSDADYLEEQKAKSAEEGVENVSEGMTPEEARDAARQAKWLVPSNDDPKLKVALTLAVFFCIWVFLLTLSIMGTGFKLLGGKDSAKMFDVADNPISALLIGVLATVLVQSSSTTTSIIVAMVGADELSVNIAIFMVMGANIGTSLPTPSSPWATKKPRMTSAAASPPPPCTTFSICSTY